MAITPDLRASDRRRPAADRPPSIDVHRNPVSHRLRPARRGKRAVGCSSRRRRHGPAAAGRRPRTPAPCAREAEEQLLSRPMRLAHSARSSCSSPVEVAGSAVASGRGAPRDIHPYCICIPSKVCILQLVGLHIRHVEAAGGNLRERLSNEKIGVCNCERRGACSGGTPVVPEVAAQPVDTNTRVANTHYPQCDEMPLDGFCDLIFCIADPDCTAPGIED